MLLGCAGRAGGKHTGDQEPVGRRSKRPRLQPEVPEVLELDSSGEEGRVDLAEHLLEVIRKLRTPPMTPKVLSQHLETFRALARQIVRQQPSSFSFTDLMTNEKLEATLEGMSKHVNPQIGARARDTLDLVRGFVRQENGSARLQAHLGQQRCAGQEGYPSMLMHKAVIKELRAQFASTDSEGVEQMALLYGAKTTGDKHTITDIAILEQEVTETTCAVTDAGHVAQAELQERLLGKKLLGWAHSHHRLPNGRQPSATDVSTHFILQRYAEMCKLMLILNHGGWSAYTLPHSSVEKIRQAEGNVGALCAEIAPEESESSLAAPCEVMIWFDLLVCCCFPFCKKRNKDAIPGTLLKTFIISKI